MKNKIMIITANPHYCIGGMETYNYNLIKTLINNGYIVDEYSLNTNSEFNKMREELNVKQLNPLEDNLKTNYVAERIFKTPRINQIEKLSEEYDFIINSGINLIWTNSIYKSKKWIYIQHFDVPYFNHKYIAGVFFQPIFHLISFFINKKNPLKSFENLVMYSKDDIDQLKPKKETNVIDINLSI
ncbi:MAG: hypothetical protein ACRC4L_01145, partial [Mycoplasma sp.]